MCKQQWGIKPAETGTKLAPYGGTKLWPVCPWCGLPIDFNTIIGLVQGSYESGCIGIGVIHKLRCSSTEEEFELHLLDISFMVVKYAPLRKDTK